MILTPFFHKAKIKLNEELHFSMPNIIIMITVSNLHKMHLTQDGDGHQVRARTTSIPLQPISEGSSIIRGATSVIRLLKSHTILLEEIHTILLEEMCKLHTYTMDKFQIQNEKIENLTTDLLTFKLNISHTLRLFHDRFMVLETNVQEMTDILKQHEKADEFEMVTYQAPPPSPPLQ